MNLWSLRVAPVKLVVKTTIWEISLQDPSSVSIISLIPTTNWPLIGRSHFTGALWLLKGANSNEVRGWMLGASGGSMLSLGLQTGHFKSRETWSKQLGQWWIVDWGSGERIAESPVNEYFGEWHKPMNTLMDTITQISFAIHITFHFRCFSEL